MESYKLTGEFKTELRKELRKEMQKDELILCQSCSHLLGELCDSVPIKKYIQDFSYLKYIRQPVVTLPNKIIFYFTLLNPSPDLFLTSC